MKSRYKRLIKKQRGFTLIELLAVILILGIIALIAIPSVNRVVEESKKNAIEQSVIAISKAAEEKCTISFPRENQHYTITDGVIDNDLSVKNLPDSGEIAVDEKCKVNAVVCNGSYCAHSINDEVTVVKNKGNNAVLASYIEKTDESCFIFDESTRTITGYHYDIESCPMRISIPATINNVPVEKIGDSAFSTIGDYDYRFVTATNYNNLDNVDFSVELYNKAYTYSNDYVLYSKYDNSYDYYYTNYYKVIDPENFYKTCRYKNASGTEVTDKVSLDYVHTSSDGYLSCSLNTSYYSYELRKDIYYAKSVNVTGKIEAVDFSNASNLKIIGAEAFQNNKISFINFGSNTSIKEIKGSAFYNNLISGTLDLGDTKIEKIHNAAFSGNNISEIVFDSSLYFIGRSAFSSNNIENAIYPSNITVYYDAFSYNPIKTLSFTGETKYLVSTGYSFSSSVDNLILGDKVENIPSGMFYNSNLKKVVIPKTIKYVGRSAFSNNNSLESVEYYSSYDIPEYLFYGAYNLKSIYIAEGVKKIGNSAFHNSGRNTSIAEIKIPNSVETIGDSVFYYSSINSIIIGDGVKTIGQLAFGETKINKLQMGKNVEIIGESAFQTNNSTALLDDLVIPTTTKKINRWAFLGLNFKSVYIPSNVEYIAGTFLLSSKSIGRNFVVTIDKLEGSVPGGVNSFGSKDATVKYTQSLSGYMKAGNNIPNGTEIGFNPETGKLCNSNINSKMGNTSGCMVWYVFNDDGGSNINLILDHNISSTDVAWSTSASNINGPSATFLNQLKTLTSNWSGVATRTDSYTVDNGIANYTIDYTGYKARLLTVEDLLQIVGVKNYDVKTNKNTYYLETGTSTYTDTGVYKYDWLLTGTFSSGVNYEYTTSGYWLATAVGSVNNRAWTIYETREQRRWQPDNADTFGIRPVITIPRNILE